MTKNTAKTRMLEGKPAIGAVAAVGLPTPPYQEVLSQESHLLLLSCAYNQACSSAMSLRPSMLERPFFGIRALT